MLVGRESERRALATVLAAARVADSRALVLSGDAGIGKTALLQEARALARDMQVLGAQGVESEHYVPFAGLLQVLLSPGTGWCSALLRALSSVAGNIRRSPLPSVLDMTPKHLVISRWLGTVSAHFRRELLPGKCPPAPAV